MLTMLFDENYVSEEYENEIRQIALNEGIARGEARGREEGIGIGREEGIIDTYTTLVRDDLISKEVAAKKLGISVAEFEKKMQACK